MTHIPNKDDIVADLRRCIFASYSIKGFEDENVKTFLKKAETNLEFLKSRINKKNYLLIEERLAKAKDGHNSLAKRREDLLTAANFL